MLLILRSLAVYGGTAAALLLLAHRFVQPLSRRMALILACLPLLLTGRAMLTGGILAPLDIAYDFQPFSAQRQEYGVGPTRTPILTDVISQHIPWRKAVREAVKNGRLPLWNRFEFAGQPLLAIMQPAVLHPGTWIGFLLPLPQAWNFDMSLRLLIALASAYLFFRSRGASELPSLLGAIGFGFSDFLVFWVGFPVTPSVAPFPLLLLGLSKLAQHGGGRALAVTAAALVLSTISGHPETLLFSVTAGGIWFLFELAWAAPGRRVPAVLGSLAAGLIALGLTAVVLLPFLEVLPATFEHAARTLNYATLEKSVPLRESLERLLPSAMPYVYGISGVSTVVNGFAIPAGYAGSLLFPFALTGLLSSDRRKWGFLAVGFLGLLIWARAGGLTDLLTKLPLFRISITDYFVFLVPFAVAALAVLGAERLRSGSGSTIFVVGGISSVAVLLFVAAQNRPAFNALGMPAAYVRERVLLQIVALLAAVTLVVLLARRGRLSVAVLPLLWILVAQRVLEERRVYPTYPARALPPPLAMLDDIPRGEPWRVAGLEATFMPNFSGLYELEDARGYEAMTLWGLVDTYSLWCTPLPYWYNRIDDPTRPFLAFLNVRYVIAPPGYRAPEGWKVLSVDRGGSVLENPRALPRAFVPQYVLYSDDRKEWLEGMNRIPDYAVFGVAARGGKMPKGLQANGQARVRIVSYVGDKMRLDIEAASPALVGTSLTAWPGWKLEIDGERVPLVSYCRAFVGFHVPAGRHEAVLRYFPDSFGWGLGISAGTLMICAGFLAAGSWRR